MTKTRKMKKFLEILDDIFVWTMNIILGAILFGGGAWCVWDIFLK